MSRLFPVMLDLRGWPCAVLGGGPMAEEKVRLFEGSGARLVWIAEEAGGALAAMAAEGRLEWRRKKPEPADLAGFRLAISALGDPEANRTMAEAAERLGVLFNAADDPAHCRFLLPSVHRQGDVVIAVSTSGKCPALAVRIREQCARIFDQAYAQFLEIADELRPRIRESVPSFSARKKLWYRLADSEALGLLRRGDRAGARQEMDRLVESAAKEAVR